MKKTLVLLCSVMWIYNLNAQSVSPQVIAPAGESFRGNTAQIDWTIGELAITTLQNSEGLVTQGFHQSNLIISSINKLPKEIGDIQVYPNPTTELLNMKLNFKQNRRFNIRLFDLNGASVWEIQNEGSQFQQSKSLNNLPNGNYFLHILIDGQQYFQTFKIQKIK